MSRRIFCFAGGLLKDALMDIVRARYHKYVLRDLPVTSQVLVAKHVVRACWWLLEHFHWLVAERSRVGHAVRLLCIVPAFTDEGK